MTESKNVNEVLGLLAKILLRCFVLGYILLLIWCVVYLCASGMIYSISKVFNLTPHEVDLINYCGMAVVKCAVLLFFLIPYLAIRLVLRKRGSTL